MKEKSKPAVIATAFLAGWVAMIFCTSALLVLFAPILLPVYHTNVLINFLQSTWEVADEMGPLVKISLIIVFGILVFLFKGVLNSPAIWVYTKYISIAIISMIIVLGLLPSDYSRGFGIGLTGMRFDKNVLHLYILGAMIGGALFARVLSKGFKANR